MPVLSRSEPGFLDPNRLYTLTGFYTASGISPTRVREAKRLGVELPTLSVGRRKFVPGQPAIEYIKALAQL